MQMMPPFWITSSYYLPNQCFIANRDRERFGVQENSRDQVFSHHSNHWKIKCASSILAIVNLLHWLGLEERPNPESFSSF